MIRKAWTQLGIAWFNIVITYFPSHHVRQLTLRMWGAKIGTGVSIGRGTQILDIENLTIGNDCSLGFRCMLDARGGITLEHDVVLASDTHIVTAQHEVHSDDFHALEGPVHIGHHAWIASRATIVMGVTIGHGAVVGACSLVRKDVEPMEIVAGVPAQHRGWRKSTLDYSSHFRRLFY